MDGDNLYTTAMIAKILLISRNQAIGLIKKHKLKPIKRAKTPICDKTGFYSIQQFLGVL